MPRSYPLPIVVLISGNGSNLQALIDAIQSTLLPVEIKAVISSHADAYGIERAKSAHIPTHLVLPNDHKDRENYDAALLHCMRSYSPELIVLAGFMRVLGKTILNTFPGKVINIHPSLLPQFPGLNTHSLALKEGVSRHGCSIHFVNEYIDAGPLIAQAVIKVRDDDTLDSLKNRVHKAEHFLYPTVLNWFAAHRVQLAHPHVLLDRLILPNSGLQFTLKGL